MDQGRTELMSRRVITSRQDENHEQMQEDENNTNANINAYNDCGTESGNGTADESSSSLNKVAKPQAVNGYLELSINKPLPESPSSSYSIKSAHRRSLSPPPRLPSSLQEIANEYSATQDATVPVRRIKSFGDLILRRPPRDSYVPPLPRLPSKDSGQLPLSKAAPISTLAVPITRPKVLQKRTSSLGMSRKPQQPICDNAGLLVTNKTGNNNADMSVISTRAVSDTSIAIPQTLETSDKQRRRTRSGFSLFPNLFRSKASLQKENALFALPNAASMALEKGENVARPSDVLEKPVEQVEKAKYLEEKDSLSQSDQNVRFAKVERDVSSPSPLTENQPSHINATPAASPPPRRSSFFPSFFRASSNVTTTSNTSDADRILSRSTSQAQISEAPPVIPYNIEISTDLPPSYLPSVASNTSFSSILDLSKHRKAPRSRASTKSSVQSTSVPASAATLPQEVPLTRDAGERQPLEHLGTDCCAVAMYQSSAEGHDLASPHNIKHSEEDCVSYIASRTPLSARQLVESESPKPKTSARMYRSNSASCATPLEPSRRGTQESHRLSRAKSLSMFTTPQLSGSWTTDTEINKALQSRTVHNSPTITVTSHQPWFSVAEGSERSNLSNDEAMPALSSSSNPDDMAVKGKKSLSEIPDTSIRVAKEVPESYSYDSAPSLQLDAPISLLPSLSPAKSTSILQKTLRKRAYTASSSLSVSLPASTSPSVPSSSSIPSPFPFLTRPARSNSSSRLSSFFSSSANLLSTSPTSSTSSWASAKEGLTHSSSQTSSATSVNGTRYRSGSSSYLGSPSLSFAGEAWSSTTSLSSSAGSSSTLNNPFAQKSVSPTINPSASLLANDHYSVSPSLSQPSFPSTPGDITSTSYRPSDARKRLSVKVENDETPESYVQRLRDALSNKEIATLLASSGDAFHVSALKAYIADFNLSGDPIDIALRKLLVGLHLPKETQQIDRVMQAFAERYNACNKGMFLSSDQPYILAFSMIMLHTDAYNKSNKNKMTKPDYIKNTGLDGVSSELLEYLYDNVLYTPFVYAEEEGIDAAGQRSSSEASAGSTYSAISVNGTSKGKLDVYALLAANQLSKLAVDVSQLVPIKNPFSYTGSVAFFDCTALHNAFTYAHVLEVPNPSRRRSDSIHVTDLPIDECEPSLYLKITKLGVIDRKDDLIEGGKKASSRKWKTWSVMLTGSQLLLFKDSAVAVAVQDQISQQTGNLSSPQSEAERAFLPRLSSFKPDGILSLYDTIALYDTTYSKYTNVFRLLQPDGRQVLFRAKDEAELNSWISTINYGASFRTVGIRMRGSSESASPTIFPSDESRRQPAHFIESHTSGSSNVNVSAFDNLLSAPGPIVGNDRIATHGNTLGSRPNLYGKSGFPHASHSGHSPRERGEFIGRRQGWRSEAVRIKIVELDGKIKLEQNTLAADLRVIDNFRILTPFTTASRQRIHQAVQPIARRIQSSRHNLAKLVCCRECLCRDLLASERDSLREKAYLAATAGALHSYRGAKHQAPVIIEQDPPSPEVRTIEMSKSASDDQVSNLVRSSKLLQRSLTSNDDDSSSRMDTSLRKVALPTIFTSVYPSPPSLSNCSPLLASIPFETVIEEQATEPSEELEVITVSAIHEKDVPSPLVNVAAI